MSEVYDSPGELAYEHVRDGETLVQGEPLPPWHWLTDEVRAAWQRAARVTIEYQTRRLAEARARDTWCAGLRAADEDVPVVVNNDWIEKLEVDTSSYQQKTVTPYVGSPRSETTKAPLTKEKK